jgi:hypothetical protein
LEELTKLRKLIRSAEAKAIIEFVKKNEGTTSDNISKELQKEGISSRITTLSAIDALIELGIIIDDRKGRYSHKLKYNENCDWSKLAILLSILSIQEIGNDIYKLSKDDQLLIMMDNLKTQIQKTNIGDIHGRRKRPVIQDAEKLV